MSLEIGLSRIRPAYYSEPPLDHQTGDIWINLPSFGLLPERAGTPGIVITPACDLANSKSETVTYLPIISAHDYFFCPAGYSHVRGRLREIAASDVTRLTPGVPPTLADIADMLEQTRQQLAECADSATTKQDGSAKRVFSRLAGLETIRAIRTGLKPTNAPDLLERLFGAKWTDISTRLVRNALADDIHFLPPEDSESIDALSAMPLGSVALLRYPITLPSFLLDLARDTDDGDWTTELSVHLIDEKLRESVGQRRPIKTLRLKQDFLGDLLSRFARLFIRLGSRDFTATAVDSLAAQVRKGI
jgi:hypothetical protein